MEEPRYTSTLRIVECQFYGEESAHIRIVLDNFPGEFYFMAATDAFERRQVEHFVKGHIAQRVSVSFSSTHFFPENLTAVCIPIMY